MIATPRELGVINWIGVQTLFAKEVQRFLKVYVQTIMAPVVTTLLFFMVFVVALDGASRLVGGIPLPEFLAPGLIMMALAQNAFANTSSSIMSSKMQGNIVDVLMPPLRPVELLACYALAGVARGVLVALAVGVAMLPFTAIRIVHPAAILYFALAASLMLALLGVLAALWARKHDHMSAVTSFVIAPLTFLSGTFYSVERLPGPWYAVSHINPFFYMIDGFRYGFTGRSDSSVLLGAAVLAAVVGLLGLACHRLIARGYHLKA